MIRIININEITIFYHLALALLGCRPYVLAVDPLFPPANRFLLAIVEWTIAADRASWVIDLCPELRHIWEHDFRIILYDIFAETEDWQNRYYGFPLAEKRTPDYAFAFKQLTCNYSKRIHFHFLLIASAVDSAPSGGVRIIGLLSDSLAALESYWKRDFSSVARPLRVPGLAVNFIFSLMAMVYSLGWIISRLRLFPPPPEKVFFAADYIEDPRDIPLYQEVSEGGTVLLVIRFATKSLEEFEELKSFTSCKPTDGFLTPRAFMSSLRLVISDGLQLFLHFRDRPPGLFFQVALLPYRRVVFRALFTRFKPDYFWGRDDYNVEHILRRKELARVGGCSLGINHGIPSLTIIHSMWRYISCDRYFSFGRALHAHYMKDTWARDMEIIPVGTFGARREDYPLRSQPKPKNIAIFLSPFIGNPEMVHLVRRLAEAFPDRKVMVQDKPTVRDKEKNSDFFDACTEGLDNVVYTQDKMLDVFAQARYIFSDPSTVVIEAIQFGNYSFFIDLLDLPKANMFRDFPGLAVTSVDQAVERVSSIESGSWVYPRDAYGELIDLSGRVFFDVVRENVGLAAKEGVHALAE